MKFGGLFILIGVAVSGKRVTTEPVNRISILRSRLTAKYNNLNRENCMRQHRCHRGKTKSCPTEANILKWGSDPLKKSASEKTLLSLSGLKIHITKL